MITVIIVFQNLFQLLSEQIEFKVYLFNLFNRNTVLVRIMSDFAIHLILL